MRRIFTFAHYTKGDEHKRHTTTDDMNPGETTIKKIMQFAAAYRVEKVPENHLIEYFLN